MKVWILSHLADSPGTRRTMELFERLGHEVRHVAPASVHLYLAAAARGPGPDGQIGEGELSLVPHLGEADLVYTRLGATAPLHGLDVARHLELMGYLVVNPADALERCRDKFRSFQLLARSGLPVPPTMLVSGAANFSDIAAELGDPPYIVKLPLGSKGGGVSIVESQRSLRSVLDMLAATGQRVLVQRFIAEAAGTDVRVTVFGGRADFAVRRRALGDEFRSNIHLGGQDLKAELDPQTRLVAERAAEVHGLSVAGIDILESADGPMIAEVNGSPGIAGVHNQYGPQLLDVFREFVEGAMAGA